MANFISVDVEADGPCPGLYSMVSFGAVVVNNHDDVFYGKLKPISDLWIPRALEVSGHAREETYEFDHPQVVMLEFFGWLSRFEKPMFISDNNGFDWQFINYYFHRFHGTNPFGHSSTNLSSLYKGLAGTMFKNFKHLRKTDHTHHPVDDARGNAEALIAMTGKYGLKINL